MALRGVGDLPESLGSQEMLGDEGDQTAGKAEKLSRYLFGVVDGSNMLKS